MHTFAAMEHHMYEDTVSITLYLTYAALMMGLMVCSILSPIRTVTVDSRQLTLYGVAIAFDMPPAGWDVDVSDSDSTVSSSSISSSSSSTTYAERSTADSNRVLLSGSNEVGGTASGAAVSDTLRSPYTPSRLDDYFARVARLHFSLAEQDRYSRKAASAAAASPAAASAAATASSDSSTPAETSSRNANQRQIYNGSSGNQTQRVYFKDISSSDLARCMSAYLAFAFFCLLFSVLLIVAMFIEVLPVEAGLGLRICVRIVTVAGPLCAILCFAMAAALGLQGKLVRHVADGYYTNTTHHATVSRLHSGFSTTAAAAFIALVMVLLSPVLWKQ